MRMSSLPRAGTRSTLVLVVVLLASLLPPALASAVTVPSEAPRPEPRREIPVTERAVSVPRIEVTPDQVDFGAVPVDAAVTAEVRAANAGEGTVTIIDAAVTGTDDVTATLLSCTIGAVPGVAAFAAVTPRAVVAPPRVVELAPDGFCDIELRYRPQAAGALDGAQLVIGASPVGATVALEGSAAREPVGALVVEPLRVAFGDRPAGPPVTATVTASNAGDGDLRITDISIRGVQVRVAATRCPDPERVLAPGTSCAIDVEYRPVADLRMGGLLVVASTAPDGVRRVPLEGRGVTAAPLARIDPAPVDVGLVDVGADASVPVRVVNDGGRVLVIDRVRVEGGVGVSVEDTCDGVQVPVGGSCAVDVEVTPVSAGDLEGVRLAVSSNDPAGDRTAQVRGAGVRAPVGHVVVDPARVDFGEVPVSSSLDRAVVVRSVGDGPVLIQGVDLRTVRGGFVLTGDDCTRTQMRPGASCEVSVRFSPAAPAVLDAELAIAADVDDPPTVALRGTGIRVDPPAGKVDPGPGTDPGFGPGIDPEPGAGPGPDQSGGPDVVGGPTGPPATGDGQPGGVPIDDTPASDEDTPVSGGPDAAVVVAALVLAVLVGTLPLTVPERRPRWVRRHLSVRLRDPVAPDPTTDDRGRGARTVRLVPRPGPAAQSIDEEDESW
jgi:hypothetical protein